VPLIIVGITGLLWNRHFGHSTQITINDNSSEAVECIQQNCDLNGVAWRKGASNYDSPGLEWHKQRRSGNYALRRKCLDASTPVPFHVSTALFVVIGQYCRS
jgi:hypothetical protein